MARFARRWQWWLTGLLMLVPELAAPQQHATRVDLLLVLAIDSSGSTATGDFTAQIDGHASAFLDPSVVEALTSGPRGRIGVTALVWSDDAQQEQCVGWTLIASATDAARFANLLRTSCPFIGGGTSIGGAIRDSVNVLQWSPLSSDRRIIDVSADSRSGTIIEPARTYAVREGITVNGLAVVGPGTEDGRALLRYFRANVIGGPGAFAALATREGYAEALARKIRVETADIRRLSARGG